MSGMFSAAEEFDVSDAGVPTLDNVPATITGFEVIEKENGVMHELTFEVEGLNFPITKGYWFSHTNPKAAQAGRGQLKRIALAATGRPAYNSTSLTGARVRLSVSEDKSGFAQISRIAALDSSE